MKILSAAEVDAALDDLALIDRLDALFRAGCEMPVRHHHTIAEPTGPGSADAMLLLMPAWTRGPQSHLGIKVVTVFPDNGRRSLPSIYGQYLLLDGTTGQTVAMLDGTMLTKRRTACASGLASRYLSRPDARRLLMIGTGALAPQLIRVHAKVRPIEEVAIWGRRPEQAARLAQELSVSLPPGAGAADRGARGDRSPAGDRRGRYHLVCNALQPRRWSKATGCARASMSTWSAPTRRRCAKATTAAVRRARVYVDTRAGALKEGGDIVQPLANGTISESDVIADLYELTRGQQPGRAAGDATSITLFKSVGAALEDLAAAELAVTAR